ncbi:MAG: magnesium transporter [Nanoarchaeota archaeon]
MKILGKSKKRVIDKDIKEIFSAEILSRTVSILAGIFLVSIMGKLYFIPALLILLPGFLELKGNIVGSLSARLGTALHTKQIKPKIKYTNFIKQNILADLSLTVIISLILGVIAYLITYLIFDIANPEIILISLIAALLAMIILTPLTIFSSLWLFRHGYDPDDIMGPYVTSTGDVISTLALLVAVVIL